jgi:hypothetical protein
MVEEKFSWFVKTILKREAAEAAAYLMGAARPAPKGEKLRDFLDVWTHGDLDAVQLDILTDMAAARLKEAVQ